MGRSNILKSKSLHLELTDNQVKNHTVRTGNDLKVLLVESIEFTSKTSTFYVVIPYAHSEVEDKQATALVSPSV